MDVGLRYDLPRPHVVTRAPGMVELGGLGVLGVGQMWFDDDGEQYVDYEGYADAPVIEGPE